MMARPRPLARLAERRPLFFALVCLLIYAGYGWLGISAETLGSRWWNMGAELVACVLGALLLTWLDWWRRAGFTAPRWSRLWVILPYLLYAVGGWRGVLTGPGETVMFAVSALLIGFQEEAWLRGIFLETFRPRFGTVGAVGLSSLMFGLLHLAHLFSGRPVGEVIMQVLATFLFGLVYAGIRLRTGSIWVPVLLHAVTDFLSFVGSTGGGGMEPASPLVLAGMAVLITAYGVALVRGVDKTNTQLTA